MNIASVNAAPVTTVPGPDCQLPPCPYPRPGIPKGSYDVHVVPYNGAWAVKSEHLTGYSFIRQTQTEAMAEAMRLARGSGASMIVHGRDGRFREVRSY